MKTISIIAGASANVAVEVVEGQRTPWRADNPFNDTDRLRRVIRRP
jgi:hypothetical protein